MPKKKKLVGEPGKSPRLQGTEIRKYQRWFEDKAYKPPKTSRSMAMELDKRNKKARVSLKSILKHGKKR